MRKNLKVSACFCHRCCTTSALPLSLGFPGSQALDFAALSHVVDPHCAIPCPFQISTRPLVALVLIQHHLDPSSLSMVLNIGSGDAWKCGTVVYLHNLGLSLHHLSVLFQHSLSGQARAMLHDDSQQYITCHGRHCPGITAEQRGHQRLLRHGAVSKSNSIPGGCDIPIVLSPFVP